ncbi:MAG: hypothetical protein K2X81_19520, partial [Candidatus Obscuribacterales bacterium]|nr:hypothetical protein [Candidatus Obscuribacterales bacterium]
NKKDKEKKEKESDSDKEKDKKDKGKDKEAEAEAAVPVLSAAAQERAKQLKSAVTPFNTAVDESSLNGNNGNTLSIRNGGSLRSSLTSRLVTNRVYLPGKLVIGKPADFVVKARPGSHVAIAMADKDSGAKSIFGHSLRLGADRKLVAAGTIPESGVLTLTMDMPIQGDLIGIPVFFETAIWQKPDFSDIELAAPVKSESVDEIADKVNAVIVSGEKEQKRGLRIVPESGVPLHQRGNTSLESGRP